MNNDDLTVDSFSGGQTRGRCLQLTQVAPGGGFRSVDMDATQVRQALVAMATWLLEIS